MQTNSIYPFEKDIPDIRDLSSASPYATYNSDIILPRKVAAIVAMSRDHAIGMNGDMPWHLPEDLKHFKEITVGNPVIMGRRTWESIPRRPLPGRKNIVVTRNSLFDEAGAFRASSPEEAIAMCESSETPFIIGGATIYAEFLPFLSEIIVTEIDASYPDADTFFPPLDINEWEERDVSDWMESKTGLKYRFKTLFRR